MFAKIHCRRKELNLHEALEEISGRNHHTITRMDSLGIQSLPLRHNKKGVYIFVLRMSKDTSSV